MTTRASSSVEGGNNDPARAHAKRVNPTAINLLHKPVGRRREAISARLAMVLNLIYQCLGMFHPHPHGKALGFQDNSGFQQHPIDIPGAVAGGQDHRLSVNKAASFEAHPPRLGRPEF